MYSLSSLFIYSLLNFTTMGVRLYPKLKEGVTLNQLIDVSDADYQRYLDLKGQNEYQGLSNDDFYTLLYSEGYEGVRAVNSFDLFGWGKFQFLDCMKGEDSYCGELDDMENVAQLIWINDIQVDLDLIKGVYWV